VIVFFERHHTPSWVADYFAIIELYQ